VKFLIPYQEAIGFKTCLTLNDIKMTTGGAFNLQLYYFFRWAVKSIGWESFFNFFYIFDF
jgi:hypothetical protein